MKYILTNYFLQNFQQLNFLLANFYAFFLLIPHKLYILHLCKAQNTLMHYYFFCYQHFRFGTNIYNGKYQQIIKFVHAFICLVSSLIDFIFILHCKQLYILVINFIRILFRLKFRIKIMKKQRQFLKIYNIIMLIKESNLYTIIL